MYPDPVLTLIPFVAVGFLSACSDYSVVEQTMTESWRQPGREEGIDILWVVDDSATMFEEQEMLALSADAFIGFVANSAVNYRLGVISTDMETNAGELRGNVISAETSGMVDAFVEQLEGEFVGSRDERGLEAASIGADPNFNTSFARPGADLEVIVFSDEDDHSDMGTEQFLSVVQGQRPGAKVKVHAVVGDPPAGCVSVAAAADAGLRYLEVQAITEGRRESICTDDYGSMLARVALDVIGLETVFALSKIPSVSTIDLRIDGVKVHERRFDGWWYNPGDNTLRFDGFAVPPPGSDITVTYTEWFGPEEEELDEEDEE